MSSRRVVLVASRDPQAIHAIAPALARRLWPGRAFGRVLAWSPCADPGWLDLDELRQSRTSGRWSMAAVESFTDAEVDATRHALGIPAYVPDPREDVTL